MWTDDAREKYRILAGSYPSSMIDDEWALIEPYFPAPKATATYGLMCGKDMTWPMRTIVNAIFYVLRNGISWRAMPADFPPWKTVYHWFRRFAHEARFERLSAALVMVDRQECGREPTASAAIVDSQTVKATESPAPRAYDGAKKLTGLKRHAMVDTDGRILMLGFSEANVHDSVGGAALMEASRRHHPFVALVYADSAYKGPTFEASAAPARVEIVTGPKNQRGFIVQKRRWVVERSFAWFNRSRRLWRVCEALLETISAMTYAANAFLLMRRIAKRRKAQPF